jgi:hypothetical protein
VPRYVIANDLSPSATAAMKRNVEANGLGPPLDPEDAINLTVPKTSDDKTPDRKPKPGMVRINEGDAWYVLFYIISTAKVEGHVHPVHSCIIIAHIRIESTWLIWTPMELLPLLSTRPSNASMMEVRSPAIEQSLPF